VLSNQARPQPAAPLLSTNHQSKVNQKLIKKFGKKILSKFLPPRFQLDPVQHSQNVFGGVEATRYTVAKGVHGS
jgi:hypothetical protein